MAPRSATWRASLDSGRPDLSMHLVERFCATLGVDTCALPTDPTLTKLKVGMGGEAGVDGSWTRKGVIMSPYGSFWVLISLPGSL